MILLSFNQLCLKKKKDLVFSQIGNKNQRFGEGIIKENTLFTVLHFGLYDNLSWPATYSKTYIELLKTANDLCNMKLELARVKW